jgi:hypothetical protein
MPTVLAIARPVQWVASPGGSEQVSASTLATMGTQVARFRPLFTWSEQPAMLNIILSPEEIGSVTAYIRNLNKIALEDYVLSPKGYLSTDGNGDPNPHETLGVPPCRPKE